MAARTVFFTIGHSTRSISEFAELLASAGVQVVVDVRSIRRSRTNPQFNEDTLGSSLQPYQLEYLAMPALGGRRKQEKNVDPTLNEFWNNRSFHNYADYALTHAFSEGIEQLLDLGRAKTCAVMCAEAVWWRCHRRIIADYLLQRDVDVFHLMDGNKAVPALLSAGARVRDDGSIIYPPRHEDGCC